MIPNMSPGDRQQKSAVDSYNALRGFYANVPPSRRTMSSRGGQSAPLVDGAGRTPARKAAGVEVFDWQNRSLGLVDPAQISGSPPADGAALPVFDADGNELGWLAGGFPAPGSYAQGLGQPVAKAKRVPKPKPGMLAVFDAGGKLIGCVDPAKIQPLASTAEEIVSKSGRRG